VDNGSLSALTSRIDNADAVSLAHSLGLDPLDVWQEQILRDDAERVLLLCSRQAGKSTIASVLVLHNALYNPGSLSLIIAPSERQAKETFLKCARAYHALGYVDHPESDRKLGLELANGSRIEAPPGSERTIRGYSAVSLVVCDEGSRIEDSLYEAMRPMLAVSGGRLIMASTPFAKAGVFYQAWTSTNPWKRYRVTAYECPRIPPAFLEEERRSLGERAFRREYLCSFEDNEARVFASEDIERAKDKTIEPMFRGGFEEWQRTGTLR
jgi:hypothetical protein